MISVAFDEENSLLHPPPNMRAEDCETISVFQGTTSHGIPIVVSCWKLTKEELEEVKRTGRVWLTVLGVTMQPAVIEGISPFKEVGDKEVT